MNLLEQINIDLIDHSSQLTNTLRKAQVLARQLNVPELGDWVKLELEGYKNDDVPEYRHLQLPVYGIFPGLWDSARRQWTFPANCLNTSGITSKTFLSHIK